MRRWEDRPIPLPQGDNFNKIRESVVALSKRPMTAEQLADALDYIRRQGYFYASSLQALGLVYRVEDVMFLTDLGRAYAKAIERSTDDELELRRRIVLSSPLIQNLAARSGVPNTYPVHDDLLNAELLAEHLKALRPELSWSTSFRRARSIRSWLKGL